jgi:hypothetical protein
MSIFNDFRDELPPLRQPRKVKANPVLLSEYCKQRYYKAHEYNFKSEYPQAYASGKYVIPAIPDCNKANGLTQAIVKVLLWEGHRATRIMSSGRMVKGKYIHGTTRKGTADISATIKGKSCMFEIKIGKDKPSEFQLREQQLERKAGGQYEFISTLEQFFTWYDNFLKL